MRALYEHGVKFRAGSLRHASAQEGFPYRERHVTFLRVSGQGEITQAKTVTDKRTMFAELESDDLLLAARTGSYSIDIFVLDDLEAVRASVG